MHKTPPDDWYKRAFRLDYLRVYTHRNEEEARRQIDFLTRTIDCPPPQEVLDLGCGDGRHAIELARRGYRVTGLDLSEELLDRAREQAGALGLHITFRQGDMREIPWRAAFDLLVNFFTSFGYFTPDEENARVLRAMAGALRPGGRFLIDYLNREHVVRTLVPHDRKTMGGMTIEQTRWITGDPGQPGSPVRINKRVTIRDGRQSRTYEESVRMYTLEELTAMLTEAGLEITRLFGDFDGRPLTPEAPRMILTGARGKTGEQGSRGADER
jgi:SAM-dependent methyltransferase